ncbi:Tenascin-N [Phytophthora ramorum]|uniref:Tenascin-N n=1 Tax=Phytophthora ramorum TaxID=164328 RepID=UPI0030AC319B|nr:Tenascin-N [Phytophthora ramorum]
MEHPSQRSGHMSVYHEGFEKVFVFGGYGYEREENYHDAVTFAAASLGDLWQLLHSTCPGSYCVYDDPHQTQVCNHCCFSGFEHTNNDSYVENVQKFPCATDNVHYSNGVCDGFGKCICKPPFIGDDCSIRDCGYNCSGHGYCSVEFPNSRCMCDEGWYGKYCDAQMCLNNCSYPNGECMNGSCYCAMVYEPYNNTLEYFPLMGDDCSFLIPFAGAVRAPSVVMAIVVATILTLALSVGDD